MTLKEARETLEHLDNDLELLLNEKEVLFNRTQPGAIDYSKDVVMGGKRENKYEGFLISTEEKECDKKIDDIYTRKRLYENWITKELKILEKYNELEQLIRHYKEDVIVNCQYTKKSREMTWQEISEKVFYSKDYCRRVYRNYLRKREIGE